MFMLVEVTHSDIHGAGVCWLCSAHTLHCNTSTLVLVLDDSYVASGALDLLICNVLNLDCGLPDSLSCNFGMAVLWNGKQGMQTYWQSYRIGAAAEQK